LPPGYPASGTLFAAGGEGFWRLPPGADTWEPAETGLVAGTYVTSIAVSPSETRFLQASGPAASLVAENGFLLDETLLATVSWPEELGGRLRDGVFRSVDGGKNWQLAHAGLPQAAVSLSTRAVAFSPTRTPWPDHTAYLASEDGLRML
jgi:hypothetical protein